MEELKNALDREIERVNSMPLPKALDEGRKILQLLNQAVVELGTEMEKRIEKYEKQ